MLAQPFRCGTAWYREVHEPSLPKKSALQGYSEALGLSTGREGHDELHTRTLPEGDWDRLLSLSQGE